MIFNNRAEPLHHVCEAAESFIHFISFKVVQISDVRVIYFNLQQLIFNKTAQWGNIWQVLLIFGILWSTFVR